MKRYQIIPFVCLECFNNPGILMIIREGVVCICEMRNRWTLLTRCPDNNVNRVTSFGERNFRLESEDLRFFR